MHLIYIYGAPAVGKMAVAKQISVKANIPLFHNHLSVSVCKAIFTFDTPKYYSLLDSVRLNTILDAERIGLLSLIFTNAYTAKKNLPFVTKLYSSIVERGGRISFIQLACDIEVLFERVSSAERRSFGKICEVDHLKSEMLRHDYFSRIPFTPHFTYNNSHLSANEIAKSIICDVNL